MTSVIVGTGMAVPDTIVRNRDLERLMNTSDEWIRTRTGVTERRVAAPGEGSADLGARAGAAAITDAGLEPGDIDALVVATMTPDYYAPGSAPLVQDLIGLRGVAAYGIRQQCSGFVYGLDLADALIAAGKARHVLVVGTEVHAGIQPWIAAWDRGARRATDAERRRYDRYRSWAVLFGDGAGAAVMSTGGAPGTGVLATSLKTDGSLFELIHVPALGSRDRPYVDADRIAADAHMPQMQGPLLFRQAVRLMPEIVEEVVAEAGLSLADVDLVIAHQANARIVEGVRKRLGVRADIVPMNIDRYGNTTAATLPILFHEQRVAGRVPPGAVVCFVAFGAGAHWGAAIYREP